MGYNVNGLDRIYRITKEGGIVKSKLLHKGNLNFHANSAIESLNFQENLDIKKVYWVDDRNQPRVLNINNSTYRDWTDLEFDFVPNLDLKEVVSISKNPDTNGSFHSGVIQYAFTYFNMYGQETNIFHISKMHYLSFKNRGGSPEEIINCSFTIKVDDLDYKFDYVRIYSVTRTSENGEPLVRKVIDVPIKKIDDRVIPLPGTPPVIGSNIEESTTAVHIVDNGIIGEIMSPTHLLYLGGEELIIGSITQKNNTLFLGNITLRKSNVGELEIPKQSGYGTIRLTDLLNNKNGNDRNWSGNYTTSYVDLVNKNLNLDNSKGTFYGYNPDSLNSITFNGVGDSFKTFKCGETYRLGVQFQHISGKWSEPIFVTDKLIDIRNLTEASLDWSNNVENVTYKGIKAKMTLHDTQYKLIETLLANNYFKVRPIIVYPEAHDRTVVAQGVVNPTVYFAEDRAVNSPTNIASWFFRPLPPMTMTYGTNLDITDLTNKFLHPLSTGTLAEFRHNYALPSARVPDTANVSYLSYDYVTTNHAIVSGSYVNKEIESTFQIALKNAYIYKGEINGFNTNNGITGSTLVSRKNNFLKYYRNNVFVDQNLLTFHSPEIQFDEALKGIYNESLKARIIGIANITGFQSDKMITTSTQNWDSASQGTVIRNISQTNYNKDAGCNMLISQPLFRDKLATSDTKETGDAVNYATYVVHPWNSMNVPIVWGQSSNRAVLSNNKTSNLRYAAFNTYLDFNNIYNLSDINGITPVQIYNSESTDIIKILYKHSDIGNIVYQGNVDKLVTVSLSSNSKGYPVLVNDIGGNTQAAVDTYENDYYLHALNGMSNEYGAFSTDLFDAKRYKTAPSQIKFKTTPHLVFGLEYMDGYNGSNQIEQVILPNLNGLNSQHNTIGTPFWLNKEVRLLQDTINIDNNGFGGLWIVELYRDVAKKFGGTSIEVMENLQWIPCGSPVDLRTVQTIPSVEIEYTEGDTFLQRYDCLKTFGDTEQAQSVTEILSFMCETRINLDGRYDKNRASKNNTYMSNLNFNLLNRVYSQRDNYFPYRSLNYNRFSLNSFPNTYTWSSPKIAGALIDPWTNITMLNTEDVNGTLGSISSLKAYNDNIIGFQSRGVFSIGFNERVQIPTSDGVPIELGNNAKVTGHKYVSTNMGTNNKWGINHSSPQGLYFLDEENKAFVMLSKGLGEISDKLGMHSWLSNNITDSSIWNSNFSNNAFSLSYDKIHNDLFISNINYSLGYSERLTNFSSFYSYNKVPYMFNIWNNFISICRDRSINQSLKEFSLWENNKGNYNSFYNMSEDFYVTYVVNPEFTKSKLFDVLEFRGDSFDYTTGAVKDNPYIKQLNIWNEYFTSSSTLLAVDNTFNSNVKNNWRVYRTDIPRSANQATLNMRAIPDRARGTSIFMKLTGQSNTIHKTMLHNVGVYYRAD